MKTGLNTRARHLARVNAIKLDEDAALKALSELQDNPAISRIGSGGFSMQFNVMQQDTGMNLSSAYYDFIFQYGVFTRVIKSRGLMSFMALMDRLETKHTFEFEGEIITVHPDVLTNIKTGLGL